jgi:hypothetical protein
MPVCSVLARNVNYRFKETIPKGEKRDEKYI